MDRPEYNIESNWVDYIERLGSYLKPGMCLIDHLEIANGKHLMAKFSPSILYTFWYTGIEINAN